MQSPTADSVMTSSGSTTKVTTLHGRMSHLSAVIGSSMFMVGGYQKSTTEGRFKEKDTTVDMSEINIYSIRDAKWRKVIATGDVPVSGSGMCMASGGRFIYAFGGLIVHHVRMREFSSSLHELDTETMKWRLLKPTSNDTSSGLPNQPSIRDKAAMIYYDKALWVFAGWGTRIDRTQPNSHFIADATHEFVGWNNELWKYDLTTNTWNSPACSGAIPSPRAAHTLTLIDDHTAVLFGGRTREGRVAELFLLDLQTIAWSGPLDCETSPEPRSLHTFTRLHDNTGLLLGGMNGNGDSVTAQWMLSVEPKIKWKKVTLHDEEQCARTWHTTAAHYVSSCCTELLVFGGSPDNIWEPRHKYWANMARFFYGIKPLYDICLDTVSLSDKCYTHIDVDIAEDIQDRRLVNEACLIDDTDKCTLVYDHSICKYEVPRCSAN